MPPESLFDSEPFTSHHLVLWPDYWSPTVSAQFNTIIKLDPPMLATRPTIEAGQILISKPHHTKAFLLAAYYNAHSEHYYHLITQGGLGEGDIDTFAPAVLVVNESFHAVSTAARLLGTFRSGAALLQSDPTSDFRYSAQISTSPNNSTSTLPERYKAEPPFIHASWPPKLNAMQNFRKERQRGSEGESKALFKGVDVKKVAWGLDG